MAQPTETIEWARSPDLPGTEVLLVENSVRRWRVFHSTYVMCTVLDSRGGSCGWVYRHKLHRSRAGNLLLMEPGEAHSNTEETPPARFRVLYVAPAIIERAAVELGMSTCSPHFDVASVADPELFGVFAQLHVSLERESTALERQSRFAACVRLLLERCVERRLASSMKQPRLSSVRRAREFLVEHYADNISLDRLSAVAELSRFHLARAFAVEFGLPPHAFQMRVRLTKARDLLAVGASIASVATEMGFADQSHFSTHFKRLWGVTPGQYRRAVLGLTLCTSSRHVRFCDCELPRAISE